MILNVFFIHRLLSYVTNKYIIYHHLIVIIRHSMTHDHSIIPSFHDHSITLSLHHPLYLNHHHPLSPYSCSLHHHLSSSIVHSFILIFNSILIYHCSIIKHYSLLHHHLSLLHHGSNITTSFHQNSSIRTIISNNH